MYYTIAIREKRGYTNREPRCFFWFRTCKITRFEFSSIAGRACDLQMDYDKMLLKQQNGGKDVNNYERHDYWRDFKS